MSPCICPCPPTEGCCASPRPCGHGLGDARTLDEWAVWTGLSPRSLTRLCQSELGTGFAQWRQQAGLVHALEGLARGESVAAVSDALGYATPSNFIAMFRRAFGESPARYFAKRNGPA